MNNVVDVLIPARRNSVGLRGKNMRILIDRPLALHSVACAQQLSGVRHVFVSTDDRILGQQAREAGAYVPELRPETLCTDVTPMADVIRYATSTLESVSGQASRFLLLLDPTSPLRDPSLVQAAVESLIESPESVGIVAVSRPSFNPLWVGVEFGTYRSIKRHSMTPAVFTRRQDAPEYLRINGNFYIWRWDFAQRFERDWLDRGRHLGAEIPEILGHSIDTLDDFRLVEALITSGVVSLPWVGEPRGT